MKLGTRQMCAKLLWDLIHLGSKSGLLASRIDFGTVWDWFRIDFGLIC